MVTAAASTSEGRVEFCIDYLSVTIHEQSRQAVQSLLAQHVGQDWASDAWTIKRDDEDKHQAAGPFGSYLEHDLRQGWVHISLKGKACASLGTEKVLGLGRLLHARFGSLFRTTRIDVAWDDYSKSVMPLDFGRRFWERSRDRKRPEVVTRARAGQAIRDDGASKGSCYRVGSRKSGRMLRVYDKNAESGGRIDAVRFELETRTPRAHALFLQMCNHERPALVAAKHLVSFIDFRDVGTQHSHKERRRRCSWWSRIVGGAASASFAPQRAEDVASYLREFKRQASGGFYVLLAEHAGDLAAAAESLLTAGVSRRSPKHERMHRKIADAVDQRGGRLSGEPVSFAALQRLLDSRGSGPEAPGIQEETGASEASSS